MYLAWDALPMEALQQSSLHKTWPNCWMSLSRRLSQSAVMSLEVFEVRRRRERGYKYFIPGEGDERRICLQTEDEHQCVHLTEDGCHGRNASPSEVVGGRILRGFECSCRGRIRHRSQELRGSSFEFVFEISFLFSLINTRQPFRDRLGHTDASTERSFLRASVKLCVRRQIFVDLLRTHGATL